jgi:CheY-like chemotaxis protein/HPt (histidine-containing phosphotransfer) domain-containing protein
VAEALRVLLVEDQASDAKLVELGLRGARPPVELRRAQRVSDALASLRESPADAVLLDLGLPDSMGLDGFERIRREFPRLPVVVLSGSEDPRRRERALAAGAQDYAVKRVYRSGELLALLTQAIVLKRTEDQLATGATLSEEETGAVRGLPVGVVCADAGVVRFANDTGTGFLDALRAASPTEAERLLGPEGDTDATGPEAGELTVGGRTHLVYVRRTLGEGPGRRVWLRLEPAGAAARPPNGARRASHDGPGAEPEPAIEAGVRADLVELAGGDPGFLRTIDGAFATEGQRLVGEIEEALREDHRLDLELAVHTLKSASAQVGALVLARDCAALERRAPIGPADELERLVGTVRSEYARALRALETPR